VAVEKLVKKRIVFAVKIVVTVLIIYFIVKQIDVQQLIKNFQLLGISTIGIILVTAIPKLFIQYSNWNKYLSLNSGYLPQKYEVGKSFFIGLALRFLLPGGVGTFGKMYFVNNKKSATIVSVGVERIFLTWKNVFFAAFAGIFYFQTVNLYLKIAIFILVAIAPFLIYLLSYFTKRENIKRYFRNYLRIAPKIIIAQIVFVCISFLQYFVILKNFVDIKFFDVVISVPLVHFSHIIPVSFAGFGLRELFAIEVFSKFNINPEQAIICTLTIFFVNSVLPAFVGLYFLIKSKH
jgi:uncharacterized membrane protein YbhN (UPF0104 family)